MACLVTKICLGITIFSIIIAVSCERTKDKMYKPITGAFCFKRLTATQEYGCTSSRSGNTGVLHFIATDLDHIWLIEKANAGPYVIVMSFDFFRRDVLIQLRDSGKVSGLVLTSNVTSTSFSPDDVCPNRNSGLPSEQCDEATKWNPAGNSLLFVNWGFPIVYIDSLETLEFLHECFKTHNAHNLDEQSRRSLCAIEITSHMLAAVDTRTCIRRSNMINNLSPMKYCDPLGDWNIYLPVYPRIKVENQEDRQVILVTARLDGSSLFDGLVPGAMSPVTGIVSILTIAHYLKNMTKNISELQEKNVIFMLLNGESYDYIGSSRIVFDMEEGLFPYRLNSDVPLKLKNVGLIVELDQITQRELYLHYNENTSKGKLLGEFTSALRKSAVANITINESKGKLPPASVQTFIKSDPDIDGIVITGYDQTYRNSFYHSILDNADAIDYKYVNGTDPENDSVSTAIADASFVIAKALYSILKNGQSVPDEVKPDARLVNELLHCYLDSISCEMFEKVTFNQKLLDKPPSMYVGVTADNNTITILTGLLLAYLTGNEVPLNQSMCLSNDSDTLHRYFWMSGESTDGICIESMMNITIAKSPAFDIEDYDWLSNKYSSWTESVWQQMTARVFLKPSKHHEILTISLGLLVLLLSFVVVYFINTKADVLFNHQVLASGIC